MKRFRFSLQAILEKRTRIEEEIRRELGQKNSQLFQEQQQLAHLHNELESMQRIEKERREAQDADIIALRQSVSYRNKLKLLMLSKGKNIQKIEAQQSEIRQRLLKASQQKRAIELLKEKRFCTWNQEYKRREQIRIDEVSQQSHIRNKSDRQCT